MTDTGKLESLVERATPGPYSVEAFNEIIAGEHDYASMILAGDGESIVAQSMKDRDAEAFVAAVNALPALLAERAADKVRIERLSRILAHYGDRVPMATCSRPDWQQEIDDALGWAADNPEPSP